MAKNKLPRWMMWLVLSVSLAEGIEKAKENEEERAVQTRYKEARIESVQTRTRISLQKERRAQREEARRNELHALKIKQEERKVVMQEAQTGLRQAVCVSCNVHFSPRFIGTPCQSCRSHEPLIETFLNI